MIISKSVIDSIDKWVDYFSTWRYNNSSTTGVEVSPICNKLVGADLETTIGVANTGEYPVG